LAYGVIRSGHGVSHFLDPGIRMKLDFLLHHAHGTNGTIRAGLGLAAPSAISW
jgi:hypothetical protein